MKIHKTGLIILSILAGCSSPQQSTETENADTLTQISEAVREPDLSATPPQPAAVDSVLAGQVQKLGKLYAEILCYAETDAGRLFIVSSKVYEYKDGGRFQIPYQYGLVDSNFKELLPLRYDKIYNPGLSIKKTALKSRRAKKPACITTCREKFSRHSLII